MILAIAPAADHPIPAHGEAPAHSEPRHSLLATAAVIAALLTSSPARAVDGCQVLLCLAAPNWRAITQCVPTITQLLHDLARGKPFPVCSMSSSGSNASHAWSEAPAFCPPQYTRVYYGENGPIYSCDFAGAVSVTVNGALFARTWWSIDGGTSTDFSPAAKAQFGSWDQRFDTDYAAWLQAQPPVTSSDTAY